MRMSNRLNPEHARQFVESGLGSNSYQLQSTTCNRQRVHIVGKQKENPNTLPYLHTNWVYL